MTDIGKKAGEFARGSILRTRVPAFEAQGEQPWIRTKTRVRGLLGHDVSRPLRRSISAYMPQHGRAEDYLAEADSLT
jgi:hypothetical protein